MAKSSTDTPRFSERVKGLIGRVCGGYQIRSVYECTMHTWQDVPGITLASPGSWFISRCKGLFKRQTQPTPALFLCHSLCLPLSVSLCVSGILPSLPISFISINFTLKLCLHGVFVSCLLSSPGRSHSRHFTAFGSVTTRLSSYSLQPVGRRSKACRDPGPGPTHFPITCPLGYSTQYWLQLVSSSPPSHHLHGHGWSLSPANFPRVKL